MGGVGVGVGVGDMEIVVGLEGNLQPSGLHQLYQNSYVGKTAPMWTTTTHPSALASSLLILIFNTLVLPSHYPTKTSRSGRTSNTGCKLYQNSHCQIIMILILPLLLLTIILMKEV